MKIITRVLFRTIEPLVKWQPPSHLEGKLADKLSFCSRLSLDHRNNSCLKRKMSKKVTPWIWFESPHPRLLQPPSPIPPPPPMWSSSYISLALEPKEKRDYILHLISCSCFASSFSGAAVTRQRLLSRLRLQRPASPSFVLFHTHYKETVITKQKRELLIFLVR